MKKSLQSLILLLAALLPQTASADYLQGDVNRDGYVDINDVTTLIDYLLGKTDFNPPATQTFTVNGVTFTMVTVEGGTFTMGASDDDPNADDAEKPAHLVTLSSYCIGQTEVTQELWQAVMGSNPSYFQGDLQRPVEMVSMIRCKMFVNRLNELTGMDFRLPTEAEWEYAARGGNKSLGYKYAGSNALNDVAWYWGNIPSQSWGAEDFGSQPVATKAPNELGIYDMSGNVFEWCQDLWGGYTSEPQTNPTGPASSNFYVVRGGSWRYNAVRCRVSYRINGPGEYDIDVGLRLAL